MRRHTDREGNFERLYRESYPIVYNYVRYRMAGDAEAEDVVAEAYLKAASAFDRFDPARAKFSTWVARIAVNCMNSHYRKQRPTAELDEVPEGLAATADCSGEVADRDQVTRLLAALEPEERELVLMKYRDGLRNVDISARLGMNESTVSTKLFNARAKMRACAEGN